MTKEQQLEIENQRLKDKLRYYEGTSLMRCLNMVPVNTLIFDGEEYWFPDQLIALDWSIPGDFNLTVAEDGTGEIATSDRSKVYSFDLKAKVYGTIE